MEFLDINLTNDLSLLLHAIPVLDISVHCEHPEMEFLDINMTKDSSPLLHTIQSPFYYTGGFLQKPILYSGFKNAYKKKHPRNRKTQTYS
jgi:hypothetical protein